MELMLLTIFLCDNITPFAILVVPDVKSNIDIFSVSMSAFTKLKSPFCINSSPFFIKSGKKINLVLSILTSFNLVSSIFSMHI